MPYFFVRGDLARAYKVIVTVSLLGIKSSHSRKRGQKQRYITRGPDRGGHTTTIGGTICKVVILNLETASSICTKSNFFMMYTGTPRLGPPAIMIV